MVRFWHFVAMAIALIMLAPLTVAGGALFSSAGDVWQHIATYVLPRVTVNTVWLTLSVGVVTLIIGSAAAWLTAVCEFPGRRFFAWGLLLPLAMPGYVIAFSLAGFFEYGSAFNRWFGEAVGLPLPGLSAGIASGLCLSLTLYPYVYLLARQAFQSQGVRSLEVAQSLGMTRRRGFFRVALPMARPWLAAGAALVCMETLADFGTVKVFNFDTYTTAIYSAWFGLFSLTAALQMSLILLLLVVVALWLERRARGASRYTAIDTYAAGGRLMLSPVLRVVAVAFCSTLFLFAFALPVAQLVVWASASVGGEVGARYIEYLRSSMLLALMSAGLVTTLGLLLSYSERQAPGPITTWSARIATLGYAFPGTVLAVGFFVVVAGLGHALTEVARWFMPRADPTITLTGSLLVMLLAYAARFMAVAYGPVGSALQRVTPQLDDAARGLGVTGKRLLSRVHIPMLRPGLATAALLVFVDVMKELPITLITRPFNWDTLAVRVFQMTTEGEWQRAAVPALAIVLAGLMPVVWLHRRAVNEPGERPC